MATKSDLENGSFSISEEERSRWNEKRRENMAKARAARWDTAIRKDDGYSQAPAILKMAEKIQPELKRRTKLGDIQGMLRLVAPVAIAVLADLASNCPNQKIKTAAAKDLAFMGGWKPIERSVSLHAQLGTMSAKELEASIVSELARWPEKDRREILATLSQPEKQKIKA